jgi:hypothetical protein
MTIIGTARSVRFGRHEFGVQCDDFNSAGKKLHLGECNNGVLASTHTP